MFHIQLHLHHRHLRPHRAVQYIFQKLISMDPNRKQVKIWRHQRFQGDLHESADPQRKILMFSDYEASCKPSPKEGGKRCGKGNSNTSTIVLLTYCYYISSLLFILYLLQIDHLLKCIAYISISSFISYYDQLK